MVGSNLSRIASSKAGSFLYHCSCRLSLNQKSRTLELDFGFGMIVSGYEIGGWQAQIILPGFIKFLGSIDPKNLMNPGKMI